jgi:hypothetical protein
MLSQNRSDCLTLVLALAPWVVKQQILSTLLVIALAKEPKK